MLCTTGPYHRLRHPYYLGVTLELGGACLLFGGRIALVFLCLVHLPLVLYRARPEAHVLKRDLPGYAEAFP